MSSSDPSARAAVVPGAPLLQTLLTMSDGGAVSRSYAYDARTTLLSDDGRHVEAEVRGTKPYRVVIEEEDDEGSGPRVVAYACACEAFGGSEYACKHILAAARSADAARGVSKSTPRIGMALPTPELLEEPPPRVVRAPAPPPPKPWFKELKRAESEAGRERPTVWAAPERKPSLFLYVVDLAGVSHSGPCLAVFESKLKKDGTYGVPAPLSLMAYELAAVPEADRRILLRLHGAGEFVYRFTFADYGRTCSAGSPSERIGTRFPLTPLLFEDVLPSISETGRLRFFDHATTAMRGPIVAECARPRRLGFRVLPAADGSQFFVSTELSAARDADGNLTAPAIGAEAVHTLHADGWFLAEGRFGRFDSCGLFDFHRRVCERKGPVSVPAADADQLLQLLYTFQGRPPVALPPELALAEVVGVPTRRMLVKARAGEHFEDGNALVGEPRFAYEGHDVGAREGPEDWADCATRRLVRRDRAAEAAALADLEATGLKLKKDGLLPVPRKALVATTLALARAGWKVEAAGKLYRASGKFDLKVSSGVDWFDLDGALDFDGQSASFPRLLEAVRSGDGFVLLADGSLGAVSTEIAARIRRFASFATVGKDGGLRFRAAQAGVLDALLAAEPEVDVDAAFKRRRENLARFTRPAEVDAPSTFVGTLRPYQRAGLGWLKMLDQVATGGCLADDMGLGKTVQVLAYLDGRRAKKPTLVVAPRSLLFNWRSEAEKFAPRLKLWEHSSPARAQSFKDFAAAVKGKHIVLTTYGLLRRDAPWLKDYPFDYVVLDEAQAIKNADADTAKAARLLQAERRLALSGTPIENRISELWSLFEFLQPGVLGSSRTFEAATAKGADAETIGALARAVKPYLLRRTKEQVAPDLPAKTEQILLVELEGEERKLYDELRDHFRASLLKGLDAAAFKRAKIEVLTALLRLRQAACHPGLIDPKRARGSSAKLDALVPSLREVIDGGHKALVFSQFTSFLDLVEPRLKAEGIVFERLDGSTTDREDRVARFRRDEACKVFLISLKAGGLGLNLVEADYVFLLDPWWNPAVESQAIDRAHRIGQHRPVTAYRLVAKDTVEERVLELQRAKRALADAVITADDGVLATLTRDDLERLFH